MIVKITTSDVKEYRISQYSKISKAILFERRELAVVKNY